MLKSSVAAAPLFSRRGLSIDRLRALVAVAEAGGIAAAAPRAPTRQSQLSRQVSELEAFFGLPLTERVSGRLSLTPAGHSVVEHTRWFLQGLVGVAERGLELEPVQIGAGDATLHFVVVPALGRGKAPKVTLVALPNDELLSRVREGRLDAALVRAHKIPRALHAVRVGTFDCALYVPRRLLPKAGASLVEVLRSVPLALQSSEAAFVAEVTRALAVADVRPRIDLACETFPQALQAVRSGSFAAILPTWAGRELDRSVLVLRGTILGDHARPLWLVSDRRLARVRPDSARFVAALAPGFERLATDGHFKRRMALLPESAT